MTNKEFAEKAIAISKLNTVYGWGTFGFPLTEEKILRVVKQYPSFYTSVIQSNLRNLIGKNYFMFDCVGLVKGILWGFSGDNNKSYGGSIYTANGVPDIDAEAMVRKCGTTVSTNFSNIAVGEVLGMSGHIGVYIGDGLAVECTIQWENCVQITAVANIGTKTGYFSRKWVSHGKLPYLTYEATTTTPAVIVTPTVTTTVTDTVIGTATVKEVLRMRSEPNTTSTIVILMPANATISILNKDNAPWYKVSYNNKTGYCHSDYITEKGTATTTTVVSAPVVVSTPVVITTVFSPDVYYKVKTNRELPEVKNCDDFAGYGDIAITALSIRVTEGTVKYAARILNKGWTAEVTSGWCGNGTDAITAIKVYYYTPSGKETKKMYYKVAPVGADYYSFQTDYDVDKNKGLDGYAGTATKKISRIQMKIS